MPPILKIRDPLNEIWYEVGLVPALAPAMSARPTAAAPLVGPGVTIEDDGSLNLKVVGVVAATEADRALGALAAWVRVKVQDDEGRIAEGNYYVPLYAAPSLI